MIYTKDNFPKELNFLSKKINPDFSSLSKILTGETNSKKVYSLELLIDEEIKKSILEDYFKEKYYPSPIEHWGKNISVKSRDYDLKKDYENYYRQTIKFWFLMGYDLFTDLTFISRFENLNTINFKTKDTAEKSKGERYWANQGTGLIKSWKDFEEFPWEAAKQLISDYEMNIRIIEKYLPDGMKLAVVGTLFEEPLEWIFGFENLFYLLNDNPDLVKEVFKKVGEINYDFYNSVISEDIVGGIFHADDLGFKTGTLVSVEHLNNLVFPWFKKYVALAHEHKKPFYLHSCGKKDKIMDIFIDEIKIDAIHSFEDVSYPVIQYKKLWGDKVGIIGGIDMDKLVRLNEADLRKYIRNTLDVCMNNGRYVFGSGNTIANYIPIKNYFIMLEEAAKWGD